jgi:hypothetical protein
MLSEAFRVLQPGGILGLSVMGRATPYAFLDIIFNACQELQITVPKMRSQRHLAEPEKLAKIISDAGFGQVLTYEYNVPIPYTNTEETLEVLLDFAHVK